MNRFIIGIILCTATFYIGMIYTSWLLVLVSFAQAVLMGMAFFYLLYKRRKLHCTLEVPITMAERGKKVRICLKIKNQSHIIQMRMQCRIRYKNHMAAGKRKKWLYPGAILPGENQFDTYVSFAGAGNYEFSLDKIRIYDMTGLFYVSKKIKSIKSLKIMPEMEEVKIRLTEAVRNFYGEADVYEEERPGNDSSEIFQIRSFRNGDRVQRIHWKLSAKMDELMVREDSFPKACPVVFFLNYVVGKKCDTQMADVFLAVAASISMSLMAVECPHYIVWYRPQIQDITRVRVDDEESLYFFLNCYLEEMHTQKIEQIAERYQEKYIGESYLHAFFLNEKLCFSDHGEWKLILQKQHWKEQLQNLELIV